jgi:hypothetical protein
MSDAIKRRGCAICRIVIIISLDSDYVFSVGEWRNFVHLANGSSGAAAQDTTCKGIAVPSPVWATSLYIRRDGRWFNVLYQQTPTSK